MLIICSPNLAATLQPQLNGIMQSLIGTPKVKITLISLKIWKKAWMAIIGLSFLGILPDFLFIILRKLFNPDVIEKIMKLEKIKEK